MHHLISFSSADLKDQISVLLKVLMITPVIWALTFGVTAFVFLPIAPTSRKVQGNYTSMNVRGAPPQWLFGVVWPLLFVLISINIIFYAQRDENLLNFPEFYDAVFGVWIANLLLNKLWGVMFNWAFVGPSAAKMWSLVVMTLLVFGTAVAVLVLEALSAEPWWSVTFFVGPYVLWCAFATILMIRFAMAFGSTKQAMTPPEQNVEETDKKYNYRVDQGALTRRI